MTNGKNGHDPREPGMAPEPPAASPHASYPDPELEGSIDLGDERLPPIEGPKKPARRPKAPPRDPHAGYADALLARGKRIGVAPPDDELLRHGCPLLWQLLTLDTYADGSRRELPTLQIDRVDGAYLVRLQDHASRQQLQCKLFTLDELAGALERVLAAGVDAWLPYRSKKVQNPARRKKQDGSWTKD